MTIHRRATGSPPIEYRDEGEPDHAACVACLPSFTDPVIATWPVDTEAMYLLGEAGRCRAQQALWSMLQQGDLEIVLQARMITSVFER
jgi:hypothetical protein